MDSFEYEIVGISRDAYQLGSFFRLKDKRTGEFVHVIIPHYAGINFKHWR